MSQAHQYVIYRYQGLGDGDAATLAGFADGKSSTKARRLWVAAQKVYSIPPGAFDRFKERIRQKRQELRAMEDIAEALEALVFGGVELSIRRPVKKRAANVEPVMSSDAHSVRMFDGFS